MITATDLPTYLSDASTRLPKKLTLRQVARITNEAHQTYGGASIHPHFGDLKGQALFAVSLFPERTARINGRNLPPEVIQAFLRQNVDLLRDPRVILGTWYNVDEEITYLDIAVVVGDYSEAVRLGQMYNQIGIYDLAQEVEIDIGGTGEATPAMLSERERLPPWKRSQKE